jgi:hypothetical protein
MTIAVLEDAAFSPQNIMRRAPFPRFVTDELMERSAQLTKSVTAALKTRPTTVRTKY